MVTKAVLGALVLYACLRAILPHSRDDMAETIMALPHLQMLLSKGSYIIKVKTINV